MQYGGNIYLFCEIKEALIKKKVPEGTIKFVKRKTKFWWCLVSEIVDTNDIRNFPIDTNTTSFFVNNPNICMLFDANKNQIEIPIPGYHGTSKKVSNMIIKVGLRRSSINGMFGPYYYFGTYIKGVRYAGWTSTKKKTPF